MTALAARFREVEITCEGESRVPSPVPASWLQLKSSAGVVRFVENQFAEDKTTAEIRRLFGEVKNVEYRPMGLRAIFLAMARKGHEA
jgi:virulence-associated protein VagC